MWFCWDFRFLAFKNQELKMWVTQVWFFLLCRAMVWIYKKSDFSGESNGLVLSDRKWHKPAPREAVLPFSWPQQLLSLSALSPPLCNLKMSWNYSIKAWFHRPSPLITTHKVHWWSTMLKGSFPLESQGLWKLWSRTYEEFVNL